MRVSHPTKLYIRKSPYKEIWVMCDADDADEIKKVDFSTQYHSKGTTLLNEPVRGLKILGTPADSKNLWVDVKDPRGFVVRVRLEHFWELHKSAQSENGEILDPCVWMLQGPYARPMSLHSEDYIQCVQMEYLRERRITLRNVKRGHTITLQTGEQALYLGLFRLVPLARDSAFRTKSFTFGHITKRYLFYSHSEQCLKAVTSLDVAEVVESKTMTLEEVHEYVHSVPFSDRSWELANVSYMAPFKFDSDDLKVELVKGSLTRDMLLTRPLTLYPSGQSSPYYKGTDWRNPRRQFDYVRNLSEPTLFLNMVATSLVPFRLALDDNGAFEIGAAPSKQAEFLQVTAQGSFPALLSGRLPR